MLKLKLHKIHLQKVNRINFRLGFFNHFCNSTILLQLEFLIRTNCDLFLISIIVQFNVTLLNLSEISILQSLFKGNAFVVFY